MSRKNVEFNACELSDALLFTDKNLSYHDILNIVTECIKNEKFPDKIVLNNLNDLQGYKEDFMKKKEIIDIRIKNFRDTIQNTLTEDIDCIFLTGKKNTIEKIETLNKNLDKKHAKADLYIEYNSGNIIGWSCKQTTNATKSNYSVHKMLPKDVSKKLNLTKKEVLDSNGFPKFVKSDRPRINELFYPSVPNKYFDELKNEIQNNNTLIKTKLVNSLYGTSLPYTLYEFDGTKITEIKLKNYDIITFEENKDYYYKKSGELREAAKLFYKLSIGTEIYHVEVRWKGCIHTASPQFMIHES